MGITVHYTGTLPPEHSIGGVIDHFKQFCFERELECWQRDDTVTADNCLGKDDTGTHIRGIEINIHPDCETLSLTFDTRTRRLCDIWPQQRTGKKFTCGKPWYYLDGEGNRHRSEGSLFCKTQFAGAHAHIVVCRLLQELRDNFMPCLEVSDEGEYWETGDIEKLTENIGHLGDMIKALGEALKGMAGEKGMRGMTGYDIAGQRKLSRN